jgi:hypothetical protein
VEDQPRADSPNSAPIRFELRSGTARELPLRLDWGGTGSMIGWPLIPNQAGRYAMQVVAFFESEGESRVSASELFEIVLE